MGFMERRSKEQRSYNIGGTTSSYFFIIHATFLPHKQQVYVAFKPLFLWKRAATLRDRSCKSKEERRQAVQSGRHLGKSVI